MDQFKQPNPDLYEPSSPDCLQILETINFIPKLLEDIAAARNYIFIKSSLWRNDEAGKEIANALLEAAEKGVRIFIIKDTEGAFFEYADENGQSYWHDDPENRPSIYRQAMIMKRYYGTNPGYPRKNPNKKILQEHPNVTYFGDRILDHSKVIVIDGKISYVGGLNFGNEFHNHFGSDENRMFDVMARIEGKDETEALLKTLAGTLTEEDQDGHDVRFLHEVGYHEGPSLNENLAQFMARTQRKLHMMVPFHAEDIYRTTITDLTTSERSVTLITPLHPSTNIYRNGLWLRSLVFATQASEKLTVAFHPDRVHAKIYENGAETQIGSQNMSMPSGSVAETVVRTKHTTHIQVVKDLMARELAKCEILNGTDLRDIHKRYPILQHLKEIIIEVGGVKIVNTARRITESRKIREARARSRDLIREIIQLQQ